MAQAQIQAAEKLRAACDECREYLRLGSRIKGSTAHRHTKAEMLRRCTKLWKMQEGKHRVCLLAAKADGSTKEEKKVW
jgi:hypothetical protein